MTLALDGSGQTEQASAASSFTIALTTANANDIIIVAVQGPSSASTGYSITGGGLTFAQRGTTLTAGSNRFEVFWAVAASAFSGNITVTITGWGGFGVFGGIAFGISGANTTSPFDTNASLPAQTTTTTPPTGSTSNANDFVFALLNSSTGTNQGTGWTHIGTSAANICAEYQIASATGSFTGSTSNNASIISGQLDAIVQAAGLTLVGHQQALMI